MKQYYDEELKGIICRYCFPTFVDEHVVDKKKQEFLEYIQSQEITLNCNKNYQFNEKIIQLK